MSYDHEAQQHGPLGIIGAGVMFVLATVAVVQFVRPSEMMPTSPFTRLTAPATADATPVNTGAAGAEAFGRSGNVKIRFAMPSATVEFPVDLSAGANAVSYTWVQVGDSVDASVPAALTPSALAAPAKPGFYHLALTAGGFRQVLPEPLLAVMVPFDQKVAGRLNGYRIGTYIAERFGRADHERPVGFVEVRPEMLDLQITSHLKLADFVTHDDQGEVWPKYVALNPRLLDKLELILADLGGNVRPELAVDVHSGFRSPAHNARVPRAASDSRHQYGDAADVTIDADGDGRITMTDEILVMMAVERVEAKNPDLVGGLGAYTSRRYPTPYLHIDARGTRKRWNG